MTNEYMERLLNEFPTIYESKKELQLRINETLFVRDNTEYTLKAVVPSGMPKNTTISDVVFECVQKIIDEYENHLTYYYQQLEELNLKERSMLEALKFLTPIEKEIIVLRYFKGYSWEYIPFKVHFSRRECFRTKDDALQKLVENYKT